MSNTDRLLRDADQLIRKAAIDRDARSTVAGVATWPELAEAVQALVSCQPADPDPTLRSTMAMVGAIAASMHRDQLNYGWPTIGATNEAFLGAAERINQAAANTPTARDDPAVTARQALGVLYHGAHLIRTGMEEYINHQVAHQQGRDLRKAVPMMDRIHRCEQLLDVAVNPWPQAASPTTDRAPTQQLAETLARWDIAAHRALVAPSAAAIQIVSTGEALTTRAAGVLLNAADLLDPTLATTGDFTRFRDAITAAADRWQDLAVTAHKSGSATPGDRGALEAFTSMHQSLGQILRDGPRRASPDHLAQRVDLNIARQLSHQVLIAGADLAQAVGVTVGNPGLHGSTGALLRQQREVQDESEEVSLINPDQRLRDKTMPIPEKMRGPLRHASADVVAATEQVASLAMVAHQPEPSPIAQRKSPNQRHEQLLGPSRPIGPPGPAR